jgi:tetratricopeptide (TPR) repeat protein
MRKLWLVMALLLGVVAGAPDVAAQQRDRDWDDCAQSQDRDRQLAGCSKVLDRGNRETATRRASAFNNRGGAHHDRGNLDAAMRDYDEAIRLSPRSPEAFFNRGIVHYDRGNFDAAMRDYDEAIRLNPRFAAAFINRGRVHYDRGNFGAALRDYDEAIRLNPRDADAFTNRGAVRLRHGNLDAALRDHDEAIRLDPRSAEAFNNRGLTHFVSYMVLGDRGNLNAALRDLDEAIRLNPRFARAFEGRGLAYERRGNLGQAAADFREAVRLGGGEEARTGLTRVEAALAAQQRPPGPAPQPVLPTPQRRLALVIGIDRYTAGMAPLRNAVADAKALRAALREQGFDLIGAEGTTDNLDRAGMEQAFRQFRDRAGQADLVVLGFFGHGVAQGGNLLLPADFPVRDLTTPTLARRAAFEDHEILEILQSAAPSARRIAIFDACREEVGAAAQEQIARSAGRLTRGLEPPTNTRLASTLVVYSADQRQIAYDRLHGADPVPNSVFMRHLLGYWRVPGLTVAAVFERTATAVAQATQAGPRGVQTPVVVIGPGGGFTELVLAAGTRPGGGN